MSTLRELRKAKTKELKGRKAILSTPTAENRLSDENSNNDMVLLKSISSDDSEADLLNIDIEIQKVELVPENGRCTSNNAETIDTSNSLTKKRLLQLETMRNKSKLKSQLSPGGSSMVENRISSLAELRSQIKAGTSPNGSFTSPTNSIDNPNSNNNNFLHFNTSPSSSYYSNTTTRLRNKTLESIIESEDEESSKRLSQGSSMKSDGSGGRLSSKLKLFQKHHQHDNCSKISPNKSFTGSASANGNGNTSGGAEVSVSATTDCTSTTPHRKSPLTTAATATTADTSTSTSSQRHNVPKESVLYSSLCLTDTKPVSADDDIPSPTAPCYISVTPMSARTDTSSIEQIIAVITVKNGRPVSGRTVNGRHVSNSRTDRPVSMNRKKTTTDSKAHSTIKNNAVTSPLPSSTLLSARHASTACVSTPVSPLTPAEGSQPQRTVISKNTTTTTTTTNTHLTDLTHASLNGNNSSISRPQSLNRKQQQQQCHTPLPTATSKNSSPPQKSSFYTKCVRSLSSSNSSSSSSATKQQQPSSGSSSVTKKQPSSSIGMSSDDQLTSVSAPLSLPLSDVGAAKDKLSKRPKSLQRTTTSTSTTTNPAATVTNNNINNTNSTIKTVYKRAINNNNSNNNSSSNNNGGSEQCVVS